VLFNFILLALSFTCIPTWLLVGVVLVLPVTATSATIPRRPGSLLGEGARLRDE
jgi:hypothetical protein